MKMHWKQRSIEQDLVCDTPFCVYRIFWDANMKCYVLRTYLNLQQNGLNYSDVENFDYNTASSIEECKKLAQDHLDEFVSKFTIETYESLGTILSIEEVFCSIGKKSKKIILGKTKDDYLGYCVKTDKHTISILIKNGAECCEVYGYMSSEDDFSRFIGLELKEIVFTDTALNSHKFQKIEHDDDQMLGIQFVDFVVPGDIFQLAVYNAQNGYYGHDIYVFIDDKIIRNEKL